MKLTTILMITVLLQVSASGRGQGISLDKKNVSVEEIFHLIEKQTPYVFFYDNAAIHDLRITIHVHNATLSDVLKKDFAKLPLSFNIVGKKNVVVGSKSKSLFDKIVDFIKIPFTLTGKVTDEHGNGMPGVNLFNKNNKRGVITDEGGNYAILCERGDVVSFRFIGYKEQDIVVDGSKESLNVSMEVDSLNLNQVVVVGYGSSLRRDLTGAVSAVDTKAIEDIPFATIDNAIAGQAAGVQVTKSDGSPGGAVKIRIRGSTSILGGNDPLYVIDGIPLQVESNFKSPGYDVSAVIGTDVVSQQSGPGGLATSFVNGLNSLGGLNTDDIESITILKDASSTAIYGSKAANGVVIITTKRGKKDMKPVITASYYTTVSTPITPQVLDAEQFKTLITEAAQNGFNERTAAGDPIPERTNAIVNTPELFFGKGNTDWIGAVTRNTVAHNAELSVQGGGSSSKYFSSISYNSTPGVLKSTDYQRISGKINLENEIGKHFRFITNVLMGYTDQDLGDGAYAQALRARPDLTPYDSAGNFTDLRELGYSYLGFQNPVALLTAINNAKTFSLLGSVSGVYDITKGLQFKSTVSLNSQTYNQRNYLPSYLDVGIYSGATDDGGIGSNTNSRLTNWFLENTLSYHKVSGRHSIDLLGGTSYETRKTSFFTATATGYPNDNVLNSLSSAATPLYVKGDDPSKPQSYLLSFYVRANYGYMDRYLVTFTGRTDASSKFGPDNKYGYFPSGALAWRISQEKFLKNVTWIDDIKLRGSYGLTGTQNIGDQMYRTLYSPVAYGGSSAVVPTQLGNEGIKWESTKQADGGVDISLFKGRLQFTFDYYDKRTSGALLALPVAPSSSYTSILSNAVGIKNSGLEFALSGDIISASHFKWSSSVNITWNRSLVTKLDKNANLGQVGDLTGLEYGNTTLVQGQPLGLITGLNVTGIIKTQAQLEAYKAALGGYAAISFPYLNLGDPMFQLDGHSPNQYPLFNTVIAHAAPNYYGGFTQGLIYKNFELQLYFTFSEGGKLLWGEHISSVEFSGTSNANVSILKRYTPANTGGNQPRLFLDDTYSFYYQSNLDVFNSSYLKLRSLTLNYHFDRRRWMQKLGLQNASLFASATNVFTITKYPGPDPEISDDPYSVTGGYFDVSNYPAVRTVSFGFKAGF